MFGELSVLVEEFLLVYLNYSMHDKSRVSRLFSRASMEIYAIKKWPQVAPEPAAPSPSIHLLHYFKRSLFGRENDFKNTHFVFFFSF